MLIPALYLFHVSRKRILKKKLKSYPDLSALFCCPLNVWEILMDILQQNVQKSVFALKLIIVIFKKLPRKP